MQLAIRKKEYQLSEVKAMGMPGKTTWLAFAHVVLWAIFLALPSIFMPRHLGAHLYSFRWWDNMLALPRWTNALLLLTVFYFNYYCAIPKLYIHRRYFLLIASIAGWLITFFLLNYLLMPADVKRTPSARYEALGNSFHLFMFISVYAASFAIYLYKQWQQAKVQVLNTEIAFLKAQINPHFLFNTLNSIYSLTLTKSDDAPDAVIKLSGMMRYSIEEAKQDFVSLSKEIEYISDYVYLQRLRLTDRIKISYEVSGDPDGKKIAPLLLIPFVENAFRHGVNAEQDSDISINIEMSADGLVLTIANKKVEQVRYTTEPGTGLSIGYTQKRLRLLYPGKHKFELQNNKYSFSVVLQITLR